jgi:RNA polymerase sigma-70 factor (ECF subfamily)
VESIAQGEFLKRFLRDQHRLYGYIVTLLANRSDAEEVFQETALILWEKWREFDQGREFVPWACGIAHNVARNFLRKQGNRRVYLDEEFLRRVTVAREESQGSLDERRGALAHCMSQLPSKQRELLERCYSDQQTARDVAEQLGMSDNALYLRLSRIRRILYDCVTRRMALKHST